VKYFSNISVFSSEKFGRMETITAASQTFLSYLDNKLDDESEVLAAIEELDYVEITIDLLTSTGIGKTISALVKDKRSDKIKEKGKKLEKKMENNGLC